MTNLMNLDYATASAVYEKYVTGRSETAKIIILEDPPRSITNFGNSDIIFMFNFDNQMVMYTERVPIPRLSFLKRLKISYKAKQFKPQEGQSMKVVKNKNYIDIITYDNDFLNWVDNMVKPVAT